MKAQKFKLPFPGIAQTVTRASEAVRPTHGSGSPAGSTAMLTNLMLTLKELSGATLGSIAVSIQVGNLLVCVAMLLLGPAVVLDLLFT